MVIALTGFMGCGKSSVGKELSALLSMSFEDLDRYIEQQTGMAVSEIFSQRGEHDFRQMELKYLQELLLRHTEKKSGMVLALGGGTILTEACAGLLKGNATVIYLRASAGTLMERLEGEVDKRPLLRSDDWRSKVTGMLSDRSPIYSRCADIIIDVDGRSIPEISCKIAGSLNIR